MIYLLILILNLNAQTKTPKDPSQLIYKEGRFDDLKAKVYSKNPLHGDLFKYADALYLKGDYLTAKKFFKQALLKKPRHSETQLRLGMTHLKLFEWKEAKDLIEKAKNSSKRINKSSRAKLNLGKAHYGLGEFQKAKSLFNEALKEDKFLNHKFELAQFYLDFNELETSKLLHNEIIKDFPKSPLPHFNLGMIFYRQSKKNQAKKHLQEFLELTRKKSNDSLNVKREQAQKILAKL
jgi:tetratricopeptide (TPR) repeat protein